MLKGEKVVLRPVRRSDITFFLKWFNDPEVTQYLDMYLPLTEMSEEKFIEAISTSRAETDVFFVIEALFEKENIPIGSIGLHKLNYHNMHGALGIAIGEKEYWSRGYGTEAAELLIGFGFYQMNLHRISSSVFAFNGRSLKMHLKAGFKEEGRRRFAIYRNGQYHDLVEFGLLRDEWMQNRKAG